MTTDIPETQEQADVTESPREPEGTPQEHLPVSPTGPSADSRNKAVFAHLSAFVTLVGIPSPIGPLVAWLVWKDQDEFAADQAKEALNFNLSVLLYGLVAAVSLIILVGFVLLPTVLIAWFVLTIVASIAASRGETYRYPMTIRLVS